MLLLLRNVLPPPATRHGTKNLLLRGITSSRAAAFLPFHLGTVAASAELPFDQLQAPVLRSVELRFDISGAVGAWASLPFDQLGTVMNSAGLPFDILDGTTGVDDFGYPIVPLVGYYEPD